MRDRNVILGMLILGGLLIVNLPSSVYGNVGHKESDEHASNMESDDSTMLSPVWHKILKTQKELNEVVESGELETVHKFAFEIRDLSKELFKRTTDKDLSEEQMSNVKATVGRIAEVAAALDEYGDAGDQANTVKELKRFNSLIDFIGMQYSESVSPASSADQKVKMYVCPMDGYTSDKPGKCPLCGMDLEEKEMTAAEAEAAMEKTSNIE